MKPDVPDFEAMYQQDADPWHVETSWYERRKLAILLASLPRERYRRAWEPGCGPGIVSTALAAHVDELVATEVSDTAVGLAERRTAHLAGVQVRRSELPEVPLDAPVDLLIVAEFLYYVRDLQGALDVLWSTCAPAAHVVFLHWAHRPHDAFRGGPEMHAHICLDTMRRGVSSLVKHIDEDFLLDVYEVPA
ncbi:SAM-dependent methyltransferase [soil metagenome]